MAVQQAVVPPWAACQNAASSLHLGSRHGGIHGANPAHAENLRWVSEISEQLVAERSRIPSLGRCTHEMAGALAMAVQSVTSLAWMAALVAVAAPAMVVPRLVRHL